MACGCSTKRRKGKENRLQKSEKWRSHDRTSSPSPRPRLAVASPCFVVACYSFKIKINLDAGEINLDSFIQDDVNVNVASSSDHVNLDEDNDTGMHWIYDYNL
ncbi:hypothetical protein RIF29_29257 [Crotalaria pallida]|uniref:Uncharacterized protein n=1 Tax=Crotalaria pallida TaxID=3830 RepID=A0AAN9HW39_CROPI